MNNFLTTVNDSVYIYWGKQLKISSAENLGIGDFHCATSKNSFLGNEKKMDCCEVITAFNYQKLWKIHKDSLKLN